MEFKELIREKVAFNLAEWKGKLGYIEVLDSSRNGSVGIGKLEPAVQPISGTGTAQISEYREKAAEIAGEFKVASSQSTLQKMVASKWLDYKVRAAAANALMSIAAKDNVGLIEEMFGNKTNFPRFK